MGADHEKTHYVGDDDLHHENEPQAHADRRGNGRRAVCEGECEDHGARRKEVGDGGVGGILELAEDVGFGFIPLTDG